MNNIKAIVKTIIEKASMITKNEMSWPPIKKSSEQWCVQPHLLDYEKTCTGFTWDKIRRALDGLPGGLGLNIAHEAVDRHANGSRRDQHL